MSNDVDREHPLRSLADGDLEFVQRLVLASGSIKDVASQYGVSYPTIRAKLDKLIERLQALVNGQPADPMAELLADFIARGDLTAGTGRAILELHRSLLSEKKEK